MNHIEFDSSKDQLSEFAFFSFIFFTFISMFLLFIRLFQLTIVKGEYYQTLSKQNRIREVIVEPDRGEIIDRKGFTIAKNIAADYDYQKNYIKDKVDRIKSKRIYQSGEALSTVIGYRQSADKQDIESDNCIHRLSSGEKVGKKGVEKLFDCSLRGVEGKILQEVDASGNYVKTINVIKPASGQKIQLSIDAELQKTIYDIIKDKKAAVIVNNPQNGELLALVSSPSYDPQAFEDQDNQLITKYFNDKNQPLFNRTTEGVYAPGSIFKLVTAMAGLEEKKIDKDYEIEDKGFIKAGSLTFGNWYFLEYGKTDGIVNLTKALQRSNDIYFYLSGSKTGVENIKIWAEKLGYSRKTNIGFEEEEGIIPSSFWKKETIKDNWYLGDTYNLSIGQGYVNITPIQTIGVTSVFANNGYLCQPQLLKNSEKNCKKINISQKNIDLIKEGMKLACSPGGTGWPLFDFKIKDHNNQEQIISIGCKTGTAESHAKSGKPHAWITAFAPFDNPEIALSVLVEEGGQGSDIAGPIAKEIFKAYFERKE